MPISGWASFTWSMDRRVGPWNDSASIAIAALEEVVDVMLGRPFAHQRDDAEFEDLARFGYLLVGQSRQAQQVDDALADAGACGCGDKCAAAGADFDGDHAVGLQSA